MITSELFPQAEEANLPASAHKQRGGNALHLQLQLAPHLPNNLGWSSERHWGVLIYNSALPANIYTFAPIFAIGSFGLLDNLLGCNNNLLRLILVFSMQRPS